MNTSENVYNFVDIDKDDAGWWVVLLGRTRAGGVPVREPLRLFPHSRLAPRSARHAAHYHALKVSAETGLQYV